jgi:hypothetical protein
MADISGALGLDEEPAQQNAKATVVSASVRRRFADCPYSYCFNQVAWTYACGTLTLEGTVASFYLKQLLQSFLRDIEYVDHVANFVLVVSVTGLSSEPDREHLVKVS